ncbi:MAG: alpha/beta hydrolase [Alphaproteobacteria bacterium]|nr:alpha/beta hydrolase [Alphaproteobacteria bacterium]
MEIGADGLLINPQKLIDNKVVSSEAIIGFPVFDIDSGANTGGQFAPEIDDVSFNGTFKKVLMGINNQWTDDAIIVPIGEIKFGEDNELRVDIDQGNIGAGEFWCMAIDWVAIEFKVAAPFVLAHGIAAQADTWDESSAPGVLSALDDRGVLHTRFSVGANDTTGANANALRGPIQSFLDGIKADKVHIIAHSKGGLDTQALAQLGLDFEILSLSTLSTPYLGSVSADLGVIQKTAATSKINIGADPNGYAAAFIGTITLGFGPQLPGLADPTTYGRAGAINLGSGSNIGATFSIGADADLNGDQDLQSNEAAGFPGPLGLTYIAKRSWRVVRTFASAVILRIETRTLPRGLRTTVLTYRTVLAGRPRPNDIVVAVESALAQGTNLRTSPNHHVNMKTAENINLFLDRTIPLGQ